MRYPAGHTGAMPDSPADPTAFDAAREFWATACSTARPQRPVLLIVAADTDHPTTGLAPGYADSWRRLTASGETQTARLAAHLGVELRVIDPDEATSVPDTDLVLLGDVGRGLTTAAAITARRLHPMEPQRLVGRGRGATDLQWMAKVAAVRDAGLAAEPHPVILTCAEVLRTCAQRGIPVLLDGAVGAAAAAYSTELPPVQAPATSTEPAQHLLLEPIGVRPWLSGLPIGAGMGALAGYGLLRLALAARSAN